MSLPEFCRDAQLMPPVFQIVSDRRGMMRPTTSQSVTTNVRVLIHDASQVDELHGQAE